MSRTQDKKIVQTSLTRNEYKALIETLSRKQLSIHDGLHDAALRLIQEENTVDSGDPFFKIKAPVKGSGLGDLSVNHDSYLYSVNKKNKGVKKARRNS